MLESLSGIVVALVGVAGVWLTARAKLKGDRGTEDISWFEKLTTRMDAQAARIDEQDTKLTALRAELEEVKLANFDLRALVQAFVQHVHQWRHRTPPSEWPEPPREVAERMGDED